MKRIAQLTVAAALVASTTTMVALPAGAKPADTGWDDKVDYVVGSGSDTTYKVVSDLASIYNQAPGCTIATSDTGTAPNFVAPLAGDCVINNQNATDIAGNWDHDVVVSKYPTGSSQGVKELVDGRSDFARSSRGPKTSGESGTAFWGFAKDGIVVTTLGGRAPLNVTPAQVKGIWNCTITNWNQLDPSLPSATIHPYGMNPSSGTKATFDSFLGFDANAGSCVKKLNTGVFPFENDVKQITENGAVGVPLADAIWWGSYAEFKTYEYKRQSAQFMTIGGVGIGNNSISNNSYPITRYVYHVTKTSSVAPAAGGLSTGATAGKAGAVREFTEWMCKPRAAHTVSDYTGVSLFDEATNAITGSGYLRIPNNERSSGGVCSIALAP